MNDKRINLLKYAALDLLEMLDELPDDRAATYDYDELCQRVDACMTLIECLAAFKHITSLYKGELPPLPDKAPTPNTTIGWDSVETSVPNEPDPFEPE